MAIRTVLACAVLAFSPRLQSKPAPPVQHPASAHPELWEPVWSDEFDGKELDRSKWKFETGGHGFGNNELQFYTDRAENTHVEGGSLVTGLGPKSQNQEHGRQAQSAPDVRTL